MKVQYFSEFFTYFFKGLSINKEVYVKLACMQMYQMNIFVYRVEELIAPVLINQNLNESCIFSILVL